MTSEKSEKPRPVLDPVERIMEIYCPRTSEIAGYAMQMLQRFEGAEAATKDDVVG